MNPTLANIVKMHVYVCWFGATYQIFKMNKRIQGTHAFKMCTRANAVEQPEARQGQARKTVSGTVNKRQLNRQRHSKLGLHETRRLVDKEHKLKDSLILNKPVCQPQEMSGYKASYM